MKHLYTAGCFFAAIVILLFRAAWDLFLIVLGGWIFCSVAELLLSFS
jgi:hypothetical protein